MKFVISTQAVRQDRKNSPRLSRERQAYFQTISHRGNFLMGGPFDDQDGSMIVVEVESLEEALRIGREDPLVKAGVETFRVRAWNRAIDAQKALATPTLSASDSNDVLVFSTSSQEEFDVVDAFSDEKYRETATYCFAPEIVRRDEATRLNYLAQAKGRGLKKLLIIHENGIAGQIEFAPPTISALPIEGEDLMVIHCLWVTDAFTGLGAARHLLASCVAACTDVKSLATIAFNSPLARLPRSFYEQQGFFVLDEIDTKRFYGEHPISAYLMWRPLNANAPEPRWRHEAFLSGVDFCPAYPWMFGKQRYWGQRYPYHAVVAKEGLRRPSILKRFPVLATHATPTWNLYKLGIPTIDLEHAIHTIQRSLLDDPTYYAYFYRSDEEDQLIVAYPFRQYRVTKQASSWDEAIQYGLDKGIPREDISFAPNPF